MMKTSKATRRTVGKRKITAKQRAARNTRLRERRKRIKESDPERYAEMQRKAREYARRYHARATPEQVEERNRKARERYAKRMADPKKRDALRISQKRRAYRYFSRLKDDPVRYTEYLEKAKARKRKNYAENPEKCRAINRKSYLKHKDEQNTRHRENHKQTRDQRNAMNRAYYYKNRERLLEAHRAYDRIPANRERKRLRAKMNYAKRKTVRLCDLDLDALLAYLKHGTPPPWKQRVDYASQYSPDALIGKTGGLLDAEDIRAAELRGFGLERAIEAKEAREA